MPMNDSASGIRLSGTSQLALVQEIDPDAVHDHDVGLLATGQTRRYGFRRIADRGPADGDKLVPCRFLKRGTELLVDAEEPAEIITRMSAADAPGAHTKSHQNSKKASETSRHDEGLQQQAGQRLRKRARVQSIGPDGRVQ
jgi:hypothetical protein